MAGENLDLSSDSPRRGHGSGGPRKYVGIHFVCCDAYARIYLAADGKAYRGNCPRCCKPIQLKVGPGGTDSRFFTAG